MTTLDVRAPVLTRAAPRIYDGAREIALIGSTFLLYELGRRLVSHSGQRAFTDAGSVVSAEKALHLPSETGVQHALLGSEALVRAANVFYVSVHFPATIALLVWMWVFRPHAYTWARSLLISVTVVAFALHVTFPLAPPRMLPGFVDTMAVYGPSAYGEGTQSVTNQYAAMPSLHAAWAVIISVVLVASLAQPWRWLALLHPLLTVTVIVGTANHYWLDVLAAVALVLLALGVHGVAPRDRAARGAPLVEPQVAEFVEEPVTERPVLGVVCGEEQGAGGGDLDLEFRRCSHGSGMVGVRSRMALSRRSRARAHSSAVRVGW